VGYANREDSTTGDNISQPSRSHDHNEERGRKREEGCEELNRLIHGMSLRREEWGLTFDVRGGPLAGRPLDGGVRRQGGLHEKAG